MKIEGKSEKLDIFQMSGAHTDTLGPKLPWNESDAESLFLSISYKFQSWETPV